MTDLVRTLKPEFDRDREYRASYAESFMNSWIAAQIKVIREQRGLTQTELADLIGTKQAGISRLENVNHLGWKVQTLARIARAFDLRLKISFEEFGSLPEEIDNCGRSYLERTPYADDDVFLQNQRTETSYELKKNRGELLKFSAPTTGFLAISALPQGRVSDQNSRDFGSLERNGTNYQ